MRHLTSRQADFTEQSISALRQAGAAVHRTAQRSCIFSNFSTLIGTGSGLSADFSAYEILSGATLTLVGKPNPPYNPSALNFSSNVTLDDATVTARGTAIFNPGGAVTAEGGSTVTTEGDNIGTDSAALSLYGAGTTWTEANDSFGTGNGSAAGFLNIDAGSVLVAMSAVLNTSGFSNVGDFPSATGNVLMLGGQWNAHGISAGPVPGSEGSLSVNTGTVTDAGTLLLGDNGDGTATVSAGGTISFDGTFAAVGNNAGSSGRLVIGPGGVVRDTRTALSSDNFFSLNIGIHGGSGSLGPSTGAVLVTGTGALLDLNGNALSVGNNGGQGSLVISNGGTVRAGTQNDNNVAALGIGKSGQGDVIVTGAGSALLLAGGVFDGRGGTGNLVVENGGSLNVGIDPLDSSGGLGIGNGTSASNSFVGGSGSATVTGGGRVTIAHGLGVGGYGVNGVLNVSNGGSVEIGTTMGVGSGGIVAGTVETGVGVVDIGAGGTIQVDAAGFAAGSAALFLGDFGGAHGSVNVDGAGALLNLGTYAISLGTYNSSSRTAPAAKAISRWRKAAS